MDECHARDDRDYDFAATPGLGPGKSNTYSTYTASHAVEAPDRYLEAVELMKRGRKQKLVIGIGHGGATCEGAAFEYIANVQICGQNKYHGNADIYVGNWLIAYSRLAAQILFRN